MRGEGQKNSLTTCKDTGEAGAQASFGGREGKEGKDGRALT